MIEFLVVGVPRNCASADGLLPGWKPEQSRLVTQLRQDYGFASEPFSHIGWPKPSAPEQNVAPAILQIKALLLMDVADEFADALESAGHDYAEVVYTAARAAREALTGAA